MSKILVYGILLVQILSSETFNDRIRVYVDNSVKNFRVNDSGDLTNNDDLNRFLLDYKVKKVEQWLPNARPTDRDGDIYLNRYFILYFGSGLKSLGTLKVELEKLASVDHV